MCECFYCKIETKRKFKNRLQLQLIHVVLTWEFFPFTDRSWGHAGKKRWSLSRRMSRESASRTSQSRVKNSWSGVGFQSVTVLSLYFCSEKKERLAVVYSLSEILLYNFSLQACSNGGKFWQGQGMYCIGFILCMLGKMENFLFVFDYCTQPSVLNNNLTYKLD